MTPRLCPGASVTHSRTGWTGVVIAHIEGASGGSYLVRWDKTGAEGYVAPRYVEPNADINPNGSGADLLAPLRGQTMNRLPNNVTIHTIESGFAEVRYWGNSIGYVERLKPRYWIGTDRFGRSITPYGETTRLEAVWALCRVIRGPRS